MPATSTRTGRTSPILTSAEWDHPDVFADRAAVVDAFEAWLRRTPAGRRRWSPTSATRVSRRSSSAWRDWPGSRGRVCAGRPGAAAARQLCAGDRGAVRDRRRAGADAARPRHRRPTSASTTLEIHGLDAAGRTRRRPTCARPAGTTPPTRWRSRAPAPRSASRRARSPRAWRRSRASGRRLERKGEAAGVTVYDDYGHHPTAIRETLAAVRQREPGRRIWAAVEPLTFHRTAAMLDELAEVLAEADAVADRRHLGGPRSGHDDRVGGAPRRGRRGSPARHVTVLAPGSVEATADRLAERGPRRRRRAGDGRRPKLSDRRDRCWNAWEAR